MSEAFPEEWTGVDGKLRVIRALRELPLTWREKKAALFEWCKEHEVKLWAADVKAVTGRPAGEV